MWTSENRTKYERAKLRYPSDLTDAEWEHIASLIPPAKRGGRNRVETAEELPLSLESWRRKSAGLPPPARTMPVVA